MRRPQPIIPLEVSTPKPRKSALFWLGVVLTGHAIFLLSVWSATTDLAMQVTLVIIALAYPIAYGYAYFNPAIVREKSPALYKVMWPTSGLDLMYCVLIAYGGMMVALGLLMGVIWLMKTSP